MKLEDQVCSLELAKRFKELGVKKESLFRYFGGNHAATSWVGTASYESHEVCSTFTVAELGEMLPPDTDSGKSKNGYACWMTTSENGGETYWDNIIEDGKDLEIQGMRATTEADARAKMLIYLIENNLVTL